MRGTGRRVVFTLTELGRMTGQSPHRTAGLLRSMGVPIFGSPRGGRRLVFWSSIERSSPDLADSIRFRVNLEGDE